MNQPLPVVLRPQPREVLVSWIERIGSIYGITASELLNTNLQRTDLALRPAQALLEEVSTVTRWPVEGLLQYTFAGKHPSWPKHWMTWAQPIQDVDDHVFWENHPRVQVCRRCLREDRVNGTQFLRIEWFSAAITFCHLHREPMETTCTTCDRYDSLVCQRVPPRFLLVCSVCRRVQDSISAGPINFKAALVLMDFEQALQKALDGSAVDPSWMGSCTPRQFVTVVEDVVWALTRPKDDDRPTIHWLQAPTFRLGRPVHCHSDRAYWLSHSSVTLRRVLLAATVAITCGPTIHEIMNPIPAISSWALKPDLRGLFACLSNQDRAGLFQRSCTWGAGSVGTENSAKEYLSKFQAVRKQLLALEGTFDLI